MPRIAASMMVVAVVVCSIGLNIHRYPVVWQMAAAQRPASQSDDSSSSDTPHPTGDATESVDFSQSEAPIESADAGYSYDDSSQTGQDAYGSYQDGYSAYQDGYDSRRSDSSADPSYAYSTSNGSESGEYSAQDNTYQDNSSTGSYSYSGSYAEQSGTTSEDGAGYGASDSQAYSYDDNAGSSYQNSYGNGDSSASYDSHGTGQYAQGADEEPIAGQESQSYASQPYEYQPYEYQPAEQSPRASEDTAGQRSFGDPSGLVGAESGFDSGDERIDSSSSTETDQGARWPAEAAPAAKYGSAVTRTDSGGDWDRQKPLVPVVRADDTFQRTDTPIATADSARGFDVAAASGGRISRLPPIELEQPIPADSYANRLPESPIPVYPSTGY